MQDRGEGHDGEQRGGTGGSARGTRLVGSGGHMPDQLAQAMADEVNATAYDQFVRGLSTERREEVQAYKSAVYNADAAYKGRNLLGNCVIGAVLLAAAATIALTAYMNMPSKRSHGGYRETHAMENWRLDYFVGLVATVGILGCMMCTALTCVNAALRRNEMFKYLHPKDAQGKGAFLGAQIAGDIPGSYDDLGHMQLRRQFVESGAADRIIAERQALSQSGGSGRAHQD